MPLALLAAVFAVFAATATATATPLLNGDFGSDFAGWTGETTDITFVDSTLTPAQMLSSPLYQLPGAGTASLLTDSSFFHTGLTQQFDLPSIAAGSTLSLDFGYDWQRTDSVDFFDFVQATLDFGVAGQDDLFGGLDVSQLTATGIILHDVTALAGQTVTLAFSVDDGGDDRPDRLSVSNISVIETQAAVPVPGTVGLMLLALGGLSRVRNRSRKQAVPRRP